MTVAPRPRERRASVGAPIAKPPPKFVLFVLFVFGLSQFFVDPEPGLPEFIFPVLLLFLTWRAITSPALLLLLAGNLVAIAIELTTFGTASWSLVSLYLTVTAMALLSIMTRYDFYRCAKALFIGGGFGAGITLAVLTTPWAQEAYRYGIRFTGFFKDPNVTAPTALFFAIALLAIHGRWRWLAIVPFIVAALSLSRATYLAAAVGLLYALVFRRRLLAIFGAIAVAVALLYLNEILAWIAEVFRALGRQGLINWYDNERTSNWEQLMSLAWERGAPLGPGFSEVNGMSAHSTYLRLLVEQSAVVLTMFLIALWISWRTAQSVAIRTALLCLIFNALVIDATHWRILFVAIAVALAWTRPVPATPAFAPPPARPAEVADGG